MSKMLRRDKMAISLHCSQESKSKVYSNLSKMIQKMESKDLNFNREQLWKPDFKSRQHYLKSFFAIPSHVNYVTESFFVPGYLEKDQSTLRVLCSYLSLGPLHKLIREKGGAYGAGARLNQNAGVVTFSTYRDPNTVLSLENFRNAIDKVVSGSIT
jgi:presequence protease